MSGNKIERDLFLGGMGDDIADPCRLRSCGTADTDPLVDRFEGASGIVVELEIGLLRRPSGPEINVGLVPDLEVPIGHLVDSVAIDQVLSKGADERIPLRIIGGRRNNRLIPEGMVVQPRSQQLGHEAQLNERLDPIGQQAVIDLVNIVKVVDRVVLPVFGVNPYLIVENGVEADIAEICDLLYLAQIFPVALAHGEHSPAGTEHLLPEMGKRFGHGMGVNGDRLRWLA